MAFPVSGPLYTLFSVPENFSVIFLPFIELTATHTLDIFSGIFLETP